MIRYIRLLGAALGGLVGLVLATTGGGLFRDAGYAGFLLAAWVVAWVVVNLSSSSAMPEVCPFPINIGLAR